MTPPTSEGGAKRKPLTPHQKIMRAAERGTGLRLTHVEVNLLSMDDAIATRAALDDDEAR